MIHFAMMCCSLSTMSFATSFLLFREKSSLPSALMMEILLVSVWKPAPLSCKLLRTIKSKFFFLSLESALLSSSLVSKAKPMTEGGCYVGIGFEADDHIVTCALDFMLCHSLWGKICHGCT